jgi:hypothetical protein
VPRGADILVCHTVTNTLSRSKAKRVPNGLAREKIAVTSMQDLVLRQIAPVLAAYTTMSRDWYASFQFRDLHRAEARRNPRLTLGLEQFVPMEDTVPR